MSSGLKCSGVGDGNVVPCSGCEGEVGDTTTTFIWEAVKQRKAESRPATQTLSSARSAISCAASVMVSEPPTDLAKSLMDESKSRFRSSLSPWSHVRRTSRILFQSVRKLTGSMYGKLTSTGLSQREWKSACLPFQVPRSVF